MLLYDNMQEEDALLGTCGGIENKFNSCWLISAIQLLNSTALHKLLCGESMSLFLIFYSHLSI